MSRRGWVAGLLGTLIAAAVVLGSDTWLFAASLVVLGIGAGLLFLARRS